jgi:hypothetical protein
MNCRHRQQATALCWCVRWHWVFAARKFPTGLLHLALVNTANNLAHYQEPAEQRAEHRVVEKPPMQPA